MGIKQLSSPDSGYVNKFQRAHPFDSTGAGGASYVAPVNGHSATGGAISDYTDPTGKIMRAHIFTGSGTFDVSAVGEGYGSTVEYLVVAGGGGGYGGGGGAGGYRSSITGESTGGGGSFCLLYTSPSPRDRTRSRMPSSA